MKMIKNIPLVSVLITAYNRETYIADAIESVLKSIFIEFELIVVDDCSSDRTFEISKSYEKKDSRVSVYQNEKNLGDYPNRNKAASYSRGKYIKYLDSDDVMYPHCLFVMVTAMEQFPEAGFGLSSTGDRKVPYPIVISPQAAYLEHFYGFGHFNRAPGSAIILKSAFDSVGGFSGKRMIGDYEMWFKLGRYYSLVKFPIDLYWARAHESQESKSDYALDYAYLRENVFIEALNHSDCPINEQEKTCIRQEKKIKKLKNKIFKFIIS
jgi:glycosyltransferase involved in cell wall biosynthesis